MWPFRCKGWSTTPVAPMQRRWQRSRAIWAHGFASRAARTPVLCHDGQSGYEVPVPQVEAANTNGAGDLWHGAFALALARGQDAATAVAGANEAAARFVSGDVFPRQSIIEGR